MSETPVSEVVDHLEEGDAMAEVSVDVAPEVEGAQGVGAVDDGADEDSDEDSDEESAEDQASEATPSAKFDLSDGAPETAAHEAPATAGEAKASEQRPA